MTTAIVITLAACAVNLWCLRRARRFEVAAQMALKRARALHEEVTLILIDNDRLRREGVWFDGQRWHARYVVETAGASGAEAKAALMGALTIAARVVPFRQRAH